MTLPPPPHAQLQPHPLPFSLVFEMFFFETDLIIKYSLCKHCQDFFTETSEKVLDNFPPFPSE